MAIIPRDVESKEDADSEPANPFGTLYGPPELPGSNTETSVFADTDPAAK